MRAPLTAGTLLLVSAYLLLYDSADTVVAGDRISPGLQSVYDTLGRGGMLIAGGIVAYLLGTVVTRSLTRSMRLRQAALVPRVAAPEYRDARRKPRRLALQAPFSRPALARVFRLCEERDLPAETVLAEIVLSGGKRLLVANRDLYAHYDRLQAEAELRLAIVPPALLLAVAVTLQVPAALGVEIAAVAFVAAISVMVLGDAQAILCEANSMYAHMVADGLVSTPTLDPGTHPATEPEPD
jgi:hypothetical protein